MSKSTRGLAGGESGEQMRWAAIETFTKDVSYAWRVLRRNRGFTTVAVLTVALGVGASTAMFSVLYGVLLQPLPYADADRLVSFGKGDPPNPWISSLQLEEIAPAVQSFVDIGAYFVAAEDVTLSDDNRAEVLKGARMSANLVDILGVTPLAGRDFLPEEDIVGGPPSAIISADLWRRRFNEAPSVIGRTLTLNSMPYTVVGVLPASFQFPVSAVDVWFPQPSQTTFLPPQFRARFAQLRGIGRLKPGVTPQQAEAELNILNDRYIASTPRGATVRAPIRVVPVKDHQTAPVSRMLWMLAGAVAFVLLIGCANVAMLLMVRSTSRGRELALRTALGAGRARLVRQFLTESLVLSLIGGVIGVVLANAAVNLLRSMTLIDLPRGNEIELSWVVLAFAIGLSVLVGLLFGSVPSLQAVPTRLADRLSHSGSGNAAPVERVGLLAVGARGLLVVTQVALSMILLVGAGLMMRTLSQLASIEPGFQSSGLLTMRIPLPMARYDTPEKRLAFYDALISRLESAPGVTGVAVSRSLPTSGNAMSTGVQIVGQEVTPPGHVTATQNVTPGYFRVMRIPLRRGRELTPRDSAPDAAPVALVNEAFVRRYWPMEANAPDPIGSRLRSPVLATTPIEIVGVVADVREHQLTAEASPQIYVSHALNTPQLVHVALRVETDPMSFVGVARAAIQAIDPNQAPTDIRTMDEVLKVAVGQRHLVARLIVVFAALASLLAAIGIYGVLAYTVAARTEEIGIRRALGADAAAVLRSVLRQGVALTIVGVVAGLAGAFALTRLIEALLFGVSATDPITFAGVAGAFICVALLASLVPAWRAIRVEPVRALRP